MKKILFLTRNRSSRGGHMILFELIDKIRSQKISAELATLETSENINKTNNLKLWENKRFKSILVESNENKNQERLNYIEQATHYINLEYNNYDRIILDSWYNVLGAIKSKKVSEKIFHLAMGDPDNQSGSDFWKNILFDTIPFFPINRIALSKSSGEVLMNRYGIKTQVMTTYVNDIFHETDFFVTDRITLNVVASAADFNPNEKGLDLLLNSLENLSMKYKLKLTLVTLEPIKHDITKFTFPIEIVNANTPEAVAKELSKHDIFVNTSVRETFCMALAEAITLGMPAIALDSIGNREYFNGSNFIFVKKPADFVSQLESIFDINRRKSLNKVAKLSMAKYTSEVMVQSFSKIINL